MLGISTFTGPTVAVSKGGNTAPKADISDIIMQTGEGLQKTIQNYQQKRENQKKQGIASYLKAIDEDPIRP